MNQENASNPESDMVDADPSTSQSETQPEAPAATDTQALEAQLQQLRDDYLRAQAEMQNTRRRAEEDVAKARKFGIEGFAEHLLPVIDSLEAALHVENATVEQLREGSEATLRQLLSALERNKVTPIAPAQGDRFDPNLHQAMFEAPVPGTRAGDIIQVMSQGFTIGERLLRPAQVGVSSGGPAVN